MSQRPEPHEITAAAHALRRREVLVAAGAGPAVDILARLDRHRERRDGAGRLSRRCRRSLLRLQPGVTARRFLRGHQRTNAAGLARFTTIWPGWYTGRTPHIHLKVRVGGNEVHTGQVFFPDATSARVYRGSRYGSRGSADTSNSDDSIYERGSLLKVRSLRSGRYSGSITLVVDAG